MPDGDTRTPVVFGVFVMPADANLHERKMVRSGQPLRRSWRGLISEHQTRQEAYDAWREGQFVREVFGA